jgi:hypothetical protein
MRTVRPRRSIWFGIGVVTAFFVAVTLAVGWVGSGAPDIPHAAGGDHATCAACHPIDRLPGDHRGRIDASCRSCHSEGSAEASAPAGRPATPAVADAEAVGSSATLAT